MIILGECLQTQRRRKSQPKNLERIDSDFLKIAHKVPYIDEEVARINLKMR